MKNRKRPEKPTPDWPLTIGSNGQWIKKFKGKQYCFGVWEQPDEALKRYEEEWPFIIDGREIPLDTEDNIDYLVNYFLTLKQKEQRKGDIGDRWMASLIEMGKLIISAMGRDKELSKISSADFRKLRECIDRDGRSPQMVAKEMRWCRGFFKFAIDEDLIDKVPYGQAFRSPRAKQIRKWRNERPKKLYEANEIRNLIKSSKTRMKAAIYLGINAGLNNVDICNVRISHLSDGWMNYPRVKTEVPRRCPLWPETIKAIEAALESREQPAHKSADEYIFLNKFGTKWSTDAISSHMRKIRKRATVETGGFSFLRTTFRTIADDLNDQVAANTIMGHVDSTMGGVYRQEVLDERLLNITNHVRGWLLGKLDRQAKQTS